MRRKPRKPRVRQNPVLIAYAILVAVLISAILAGALYITHPGNRFERLKISSERGSKG